MHGALIIAANARRRTEGLRRHAGPVQSRAATEDRPGPARTHGVRRVPQVGTQPRAPLAVAPDLGAAEDGTRENRVGRQRADGTTTQPFPAAQDRARIRLVLRGELRRSAAAAAAEGHDGAGSHAGHRHDTAAAEGEGKEEERLRPVLGLLEGDVQVRAVGETREGFGG